MYYSAPRVLAQMHRLTLAFDDPELERLFLADSVRGAPERARRGILVGVAALILMYVPMTAIAEPQHMDIVLRVSLEGIVPLCALGFALTRLRGYGRLLEAPRAALLTV